MARWESPTRWYEALVTRDLFGTWVVIRTWGGKGSQRYGQKTDIVPSAEAGQEAIGAIHKRRLSRDYSRIPG